MSHFSQLNIIPSVSQYSLIWSCLLTEVARIHIEKNKQSDYEYANSVLIKALTVFECYDNSISYLHKDAELLDCIKYFLLSRFQCKDTFDGHCQAVRLATVNGTMDELQSCIEHLNWCPGTVDNNPHRGYSAMHLAILHNRPFHAWLLKLAKEPLDTKSAKFKEGGNETPLDLIRVSKIPAIQALALPYIQLKIKPNIHTQDIINSLPLFLSTIGFSDSLSLYLNEQQSIILTNCNFPSEKIGRHILEFCSWSVNYTPQLQGLFTIASLICDKQDNLFSTTQMDFICHADTTEWNFFRGRQIFNSDVLQRLNRLDRTTVFQEYVKKPIESIVKTLEKNLELRSENDPLEVHYDAQNLKFIISANCKTASFFNTCLIFILKTALKNQFQDKFLLDFVAPSSEASPEIDSQTGTSSSSRLR